MDYNGRIHYPLYPETIDLARDLASMEDFNIDPARVIHSALELYAFVGEAIRRGGHPVIITPTNYGSEIMLIPHSSILERGDLLRIANMTREIDARKQIC